MIILLKSKCLSYENFLLLTNNEQSNISINLNHLKFSFLYRIIKIILLKAAY